MVSIAALVAIVLLFFERESFGPYDKADITLGHVFGCVKAILEPTIDLSDRATAAVTYYVQHDPPCTRDGRIYSAQAIPAQEISIAYLVPYNESSDCRSGGRWQRMNKPGEFWRTGTDTIFKYGSSFGDTIDAYGQVAWDCLRQTRIKLDFPMHLDRVGFHKFGLDFDIRLFNLPEAAADVAMTLPPGLSLDRAAHRFETKVQGAQEIVYIPLSFFQVDGSVFHGQSKSFRRLYMVDPAREAIEQYMFLLLSTLFGIGLAFVVEGLVAQGPPPATPPNARSENTRPSRPQSSRKRLQAVRLADARRRQRQKDPAHR